MLSAEARFNDVPADGQYHRANARRTGDIIALPVVLCLSFSWSMPRARLAAGSIRAVTFARWRHLSAARAIEGLIRHLDDETASCLASRQHVM